MKIDWNRIDTVFLDMDGTLLDLHFDNYFWLEHVPMRFAEAQGISTEEAKSDLIARYNSRAGTLKWYCVDHWSRELGLDIALLKQEVGHLIAMHPYVVDFLEALAAKGKRRLLVTNAHQKSIGLKMEKTPLAGHFERIVCSHDLEVPKESAYFWHRLQELEPFDTSRTLFVDDNPRVLEAAKDYGLQWLLLVSAPDSKKPAQEAGAFPAIRDFEELLPGLLDELG